MQASGRLLSKNPAAIATDNNNHANFNAEKLPDQVHMMGNEDDNAASTEPIQVVNIDLNMNDVVVQ